MANGTQNLTSYKARYLAGGIAEVQQHLNITGTTYFSAGTSETEGKPILAYNGSNLNFGIRYFKSTPDVFTISASGNSNNKTGADFSINGLGNGILSHLGNYIPHTGNTTGTVGGEEQPVYVNAGTISATSYALKATVNNGTTGRLSYYSGDRDISATTNVHVLNNYLISNSRNSASVDVRANGLIIWGQTYGNDAAPMNSNTAGIFRFGDGGPQIVFNTSNSWNAQAGALIFTDHDAAATGTSFHFVSTESSNNNGGDCTVTAPRFRARAGLTVGQNSDNTSYNFYLNGSGYLNSGYFYIGAGGGLLNGAATNGGINSIRVGDDVWLGDCNAAGIMGMKSTSTNCGFYFYNSSGTQTGQLYNNGSEMICNKTYHSSGGYLKSTANGNTVQIGSQDGSFCHIYNSKNIPFIFSNTVESTSGDLGTTSYPWHNIYIGKSNGAGIYYQGSKANYRMIRFIDNATDNYGNGISIGGGGQTIIGGGESSDTAVAHAGTAGSEIMWICNDGAIEFYPNLQNGWTTSYKNYIGTNGHFYSVAVHNAVWNDFAEYREGTTTEAGRVVAATADSNKVSLTYERLQPCAHVISDTFGCSVGQSDTAQTPIGVGGRVLVYPYQPIENYHVGDCLCAAPNGTADIMTREEIIQYPDRIIGVVDEIPSYLIWKQTLTTDKEKNGGGKVETSVPVNGRIWIYVR